MNGKFKKQGKTLLPAQRPESIDQFIGDDAEITGTPNTDKPSNRKTVKSESSEIDKSSKVNALVREEFRCSSELSQRLSFYVFEQKKTHRRSSKTSVIVEALEIYLKEKNY